MKKEYFAKKYRQTENQWSALDKKKGHIGNLRLLAAAVAVVGLGFWWKQANIFGAVLLLAGIISFLALVRYDGRLSDQAAWLNAQKSVLKRYLDRYDNSWYQFKDDGGEYLDESFTNGIDLDIFGERSLFQYINIAHTMHGRDLLAEALKGKFMNDLAARQECVAELAEDLEGAVQLETAAQKALGEKLGERKYVEKFLLSLRRQDDNMTVKNALSFVLPVTTLIAIVGAFWGVIDAKAAVILIMLQLFLSLNASAQVKEKLDMLYEMYRPLEAYSQLVKVLGQKKFKSPYLQEEIAKLQNKGGAQEGLRKLSQISGMLKMQNSLLYLPLCGLLMWNYHSLRLFNNWCEKYAKETEKWLEVIGNFEALYSLAVIKYVKKNSVLPEITESRAPYLKMENAVHPLLKESQAVANSFAIDGGLAVITGSNMSGKTTFLRTIGVNLTLAYAGGFVCAEKFSAAKMRLMTSMRISDDVSRGISTFYGELLRIKGMVEYAKMRRPMLALIDEIFKGTNSADRIIGAEATLKTLNKPWGLTLVSTHDFELCDLANQNDVHGKNYHFEEHYVEGKLKFDYTIKPDRCHTSNAQALMRLVGIITDEQDSVH